MDEIETLWKAHKNAPYPEGYRGEEVEGVDLVLLDADIAGCVTTYLGNERKLDIHRTAILGRCYRDASIVITRLQGEPHDYFARLEGLAGAVLTALSHRSTV